MQEEKVRTGKEENREERWFAMGVAERTKIIVRILKGATEELKEAPPKKGTYGSPKKQENSQKREEKQIDKLTKEFRKSDRKNKKDGIIKTIREELAVIVIIRSTCREVGLHNRFGYESSLMRSFGAVFQEDAELYSQMHGAYWIMRCWTKPPAAGEGSLATGQ